LSDLKLALFFVRGQSHWSKISGQYDCPEDK